MADAPFPPLEWDGWYWRAPVELPWYAGAEPPELIIRQDHKTAREILEAAAAPPPTAAQQAAFAALLHPAPPFKQALLAEFLKHVPELPAPDWDGVQALFEPATVVIFHPALEGVSYVGLVLNCLQWEYGYEHGVGVVLHNDRIVHFGMAEEAQDEGQALKDLRRITRARTPEG